MITNEVKARIFALFLGGKFRYEGSIGTIRTLGGVTWTYSIQDFETGACFKVDKCQLILTPIEEITEEHFDIVLNILCRTNEELQSVIEMRDSEMWESFKSHLISCLNGEDVHVAENNIAPTLYFKIVDQLRLWNYHTPCCGITDLYEYGIAIKPNK